MILTVEAKLLVPPEEHAHLLAAMVRVNEAATWLSARVWERQVFDRRKVHDLFYYELRRRFALPAQHAVQAISRVAYSYKTEKRRAWETTAHRFRAWSAHRL